MAETVSLEKELSDEAEKDYQEILKAPPKLFHPHRLLIMKILYLQGYAEYRHFKHGLPMSDGLLASHLKALEDEQYIVAKREFVDRKPRTTYFITSKGIMAFNELREYVKRVMARGIQE